MSTAGALMQDTAVMLRMNYNKKEGSWGMCVCEDIFVFNCQALLHSLVGN